MATGRITITENELLAELAAMGPKPAPPNAMTAAELRHALGLGRTALKQRLRQLSDEGRLETWATLRQDAAGRMCSVPAYTIKPAAKKRGR